MVFYENTEAVVGASVAVPGTGVGTITDANGKFSLLNVPTACKTILVSYIGYKSQTIDIVGKTEIKVTLLSSVATDLDEKVVVGYGTQKKLFLTGSVTTPSPIDILDLSATSLSSTLEGLMTGVSVSQSSYRPGEPARISIRGQSTSLYVIDDYVCPAEDGERMFNNLDPTMIECISVLKDASAAIYGARSAQGVVLVKTKRGQISKPKISYNGQFGYADEFYRSKMMDSYNYGLTWNAIRVADPTQSGFDPLKHLYQADELEAMKSLDYDLLDKYWSAALTQKHGINVSGGTEAATYFAGVSYITQGGNMGKLDYDRWNYNAGLDAKINKWTKASLSVSGDYGHTMKSNNKIGGANAEKDYFMLLTRPRYIPEYVTDPTTGNQLPIAPYGITNDAMEQTQNEHYDVIDNLGNFAENKPQNMTISGSIDYEFGWSKILKGLKFKAVYTKSISTTKDNEFGSEYTLYRFPDGVNGRGGSGNHLYVGTDGYPLTFTDISTVSVFNGSSSYLKRNMGRSDSYQLNFVASYVHKFGKHDVSGLFTIEKSEREYEYVWGNVNLPYSYTNGQSNGASGDQTTEFNRSESGILSYVGRLNYNYDGKYLAEFLMRSDASSKSAPENYWGTFPSLSAGWIMSEENWFKENVHFIDFLKMRGSFGMLGRDNIDAWAWAQYYGNEVDTGPIFGTNIDLNASAYFQLPNSVPNRNSHWNKSYKSNIGLDIIFFKNHFSTTIDGYYNENRDILMSISNASNFPSTDGTTASPSNWGSTDDFGVEISSGWCDQIGKDFKYQIRLNTGYNDNKLIKYPFEAASTRQLDDAVPNERSDRGLWGYECIGMFRSNQDIAEFFAENKLTTYMGYTQADIHPGTLIYRDVRGSQKADGTYFAVGDPNDPEGNKVDAKDRIKISNRSNNIYGFTMNLGAEYKSLSISAQFGASWGSYSMIPTQAISNTNVVSNASGYDVMQYTNLPSFWSGNMYVYENIYDAQGRIVAYQNRDAKYPNLRFAGINSVASTFWKVNNANVLLRNLTVAYSVAKSFVQKLGIESCRINLTGQNLLDFYNPYPDKFMSQNSNYSFYPTLRKLTIGLIVTF